MKKTICGLLFLFSISACSDPLIIFGKTIELTENCQVKATDKKGQVQYISLSLPVSSNCGFITYDETNVVHIELIADFYMFLVESTADSEYGCISNHTAVSVKENGDILSADFSKKSLSCHIDRERKLFQHFAHEMKW